MGGQEWIEQERHKRMAVLKGEAWDGVATIVADRSVPYRLIAAVMYTAGQAQIASVRFAVVKSGRGERIKAANPSMFPL